MELAGRLFERILTSIIISLFIFVGAFSYLTGRFPPKKSDFIRTFTLMKQMVGSQGEFNEKLGALSAGGTPSLEQLAEFQRLSLRRTEIGLEMVNIFEKIKQTGMDSELEVKLQRITSNLTAAEKDLGEITAHLQQATK